MGDGVNEPPTESRSPVKKHRRGLLPPELLDVVVPSIKVGAFSGSIGMFTGISAGIIKETTPALFGIVAGIQWFTLGSSYWLTRTVIERSWSSSATLGPSDKTKASAIAGGTAGTVGGLLRGPRNIIPAAVVFTLLGGSGQALMSRFQSAPDNKTQRESKSVFEHKWSPLKKLSDDEYTQMMEDKALKLEVEIALIDDKIAELKAESLSNEAASSSAVESGSK